MSDAKRDAEAYVEISVRAVADCLSFDITEESVRAIRDEVIAEVVRLSKDD